MNRRDDRGFTLIELMVVMVVMVAMSSYVGPNLWKQYMKATERSVVQNVVTGLQDLRNTAFARGKVIVVDVDSPFIQSLLPNGWDISEMQKIYFLPTGVTNGGRVDFISSSGVKWRLHLSPLDGNAVITRL